MRQRFHKFRAATLDEAYLAMREKLGDEAIVVRTATVPHGGWLGRVLGQKAVEVTASMTVEDDAPSRARPLSPAEKKYRSGASRPAAAPSTLASPAAASVGSEERVRETVDFFRRVVTQAQQRAGISSEDRARAATAPTGAPTPPIVQGNAAPAEVISFEPAARPAPAPLTPDDIRKDLTEMREMLGVLSAEMPGAGLSAEFVPHYQMLLKQGVSRKRAAALVQAASSRGDLRAFRDPRIFRERLKMEIRRHVIVTGGIALESGKRKVVALVGATGVGKTTNLAKLAALYAVQEHARVGVITTDTYRVAATDQLQVYANIIDLEMKVVHQAVEMRAAVKAFADRDLVLIDTAGGSPFNREQMTEVRALVEAAQPDEVHLLVSANVALEDLREVVTHFSILKPTALFFTKLDETRRYGQLFCLAAEAGLPLSYFSVGQNVPDDILPVSAGTVAKLVVEGEDDLGGTSAKPS
jgi:flagellar biosynthesis protein FlhF